MITETQNAQHGVMTQHVPLETLEVQLPEEPIMLNGEPHTFLVDNELLGNLVRERNRTNYSYNHINGLHVSLGRPIGIQDWYRKPHQAFNYDTGQLIVSLPSRMDEPSVETSLLVGGIEDSITLQIQRGAAVNEVLEFHYAMKRVKLGTGAVAGTMGGISLGDVLSTSQAEFARILSECGMGAVGLGFGVILAGFILKRPDQQKRLAAVASKANEKFYKHPGEATELIPEWSGKPIHIVPQAA